MTTASIGAGTLLAGCSGNGGNNNGDDNGNNNGESVTDNNGDGARFDGVTIEMWDWFGVNSGQTAFIEDLVAEFESDTGATVNLTFDGGILESWPQQIRSGEGPHIHSWTPAFGVNLGPQYYYTADDMMQDYSDLFDDDTIGDLEWQFEGMEYLARGLPDIDVPHFPVFNSPRSPVLARYDFVEQAGLEEDFPPESFEELIDFARELQNNSDAEYGFQVPGSGGDVLGFVWSQLPQTGDKTETSLLNEECTDVQVSNDAYSATMDRMNTLLEEGVIAPDTPSLGGSDVSGQIATTDRYGQINPEPKHHVSARDANPSVFEDGTMRWYPMWGENKSNQTPWVYNVIPVGDDASEEEKRREEAAVYFLANYVLSDGFHEVMAEASGFIPSKRDAWDGAAENVTNEDQHHWFESCRTMMENGGAWSLGYGSPEIGAVPPILGGAGQYLPQYLNGDLSLDEAMSNWEQTAREDMGIA